MPAALASKDEIVDRLFAVFRDRGFDGASLADLSRATGLGKSSLYHYFPDGKTGMVEAVLEKANGLMTNGILATANAPGSLRTRTRQIVALLDQMYAGGRSACVLSQLATASIGPAARSELRHAFAQWIAGIEKLAADSGMPAAQAHAFAEDWVARVQGALVLQSACGDTLPFARARGPP